MRDFEPKWSIAIYWSSDDNCFIGRIIGLPDVTIHGDSYGDVMESLIREMQVYQTELEYAFNEREGTYN